MPPGMKALVRNGRIRLMLFILMLIGASLVPSIYFNLNFVDHVSIFNYHRRSTMEIRLVAGDFGKSNRNCSVLDFLASVDKSARDAYDPDLLCDEFAPKSDIVCRMYLKQVGLGHLERTACALEDPKRVPKIVYFVIFGNFKFEFTYYITLRAAKDIVNATGVYVIGDQHPVGSWWVQALKDIQGVRYLYRERPQNISGIHVKRLEHISDVVRLQILYMNGGIYLDTDMLALKSLDSLLDYDITLGLVDNSAVMGNAFIVAKRNSPFIHEWYDEYTRYKQDDYYWNSLKIPRNMWLKNNSRVHMETDLLYRPGWFETELLCNKSVYPWRKNYAVHVWKKNRPVINSFHDEYLVSSNTTLAQMYRYVLYGHISPRNKSIS